MWVVTASGRLTRPAAVWFTTWASQEIEITWASFRDAAKSRYSETFLPIVLRTPILAIKQTGSIPEYLAAWHQALSAAPEAVTDRNTMLLTLIINGLKSHICKWVHVGFCTSIDEFYKAIVEANDCQGPESPVESAGHPRSKKLHSLGTPAKYLPEPETSPFD
ncbi:hypothetical protein DSO57_1002210 [Entomophthora muscae]|uniref:Uncharacterized protein n=1 Tax=Entomophthora muscae TaxID=34485 RepID=A0ACC2U7F2_9FUNG|nr:hypothetical protein DSO57_1002210 [Entomophthora muscae]